MLRVLDPAELEFTFDDAGDVPRRRIGPRAVHRPGRRPRRVPRAGSPQHAAEIEQPCVDLGIEYEPITTDRPLELVLFDLLKAQDAAGAAGRAGGRPPGRGGGAMSFLTPLYVARRCWRSPRRSCST